MSDVTQLLHAIEQGDPQAACELLPLVYDELRRLAAQKLAQEKPGQTLQPTALLHEAYLRLVPEKSQSQEPNWDGRGHFFAAAAEAMRRILKDRQSGALKWRQILGNELAGVLRRFRTEARDLGRECSQAELEESSARLDAFLAADQTSPSQCASRAEEQLRLAEALGRLPANQRDCVELHHLQGYRVAEVAKLLDRGEEAVVGWLYRGVKNLRRLLGDSSGLP